MELKRKLTVLASAALLGPVALVVGTSPASAASFCDGYDHVTTRPLQQGQTGTPWSYAWNPDPGTYSVCLDGPTGANFDLTMVRWDDAVYGWVTVATSTGSGPDEKLTYTDTLGSTGIGIRVTGVHGSGDYTLAFNHAPSV